MKKQKTTFPHYDTIDSYRTNDTARGHPGREEKKCFI